jgi:hypothetical protein
MIAIITQTALADGSAFSGQEIWRLPQRIDGHSIAEAAETERQLRIN